MQPARAWCAVAIVSKKSAPGSIDLRERMN
jgi:hypothetical protein